MSHLHPGEGAAGGRRSARLHSQIHASDEGAGLARPRSTRHCPQIDADGHGAGVASHRSSSKRLRSQIQAREGGDRVICRRRGTRRNPQSHASEAGDGMSLGRGTSPESPASPLEDDDLLREILLRLPLDLHSLSRASAVCKRWRGMLVDPKFLRRFYTRHRKPPLLGFFPRDEQIMFTPVLAPAPDRILSGSFDLGRRYSNSEVSEVLDSRHGRVLLTSWVIVDGWVHEEVVVCDPITSKQQHRMSIPLGLKGIGGLVNGAVFCAAAAAAHDHVHGSCRSCPFKVVLLSYRNYKHPYACVYSSETDTWGNIISTEAPHDTPFGVCPSTLIGNALYWPAKHKGDSILQFDLDTQNLAVIKGPPGMNMNDFDNFHIIQAEDGAVGLAALPHLELQMWERKVDCQGVAIWLLQKTVSLRKLFKVPPQTEPSYESLKVVGYDEDNNVILLSRHDGVYMVQPKSMQARKLNGTGSTHYCYTFTSFYPLGTAIEGGTNGAEMLG